MEICRLKLESPLHIGAEGIGMEKTDVTILSDMLASGIMAKYYELTGSKRKMDKEPLFIISSAFPYCKDILFFPKPMLKVKREEGTEGIKKKVKRIQFLSEKAFYDAIKNRKINLNTNLVLPEPNNIFMVLEEEKSELERILKDDQGELEYPNIFNVYETSHNLLDRQMNSSEIFYIGEVKYNTEKGCGLYFFIDILDEEENVKNAIRMLGKDGIGGKRTWGKGQFETEFLPYDSKLNFENSSDYFITLSLYIPRKDEVENGLLEGEYVAYNFERRGGWVGSPKYLSYRKKSIRMFTEGSVFKNVSDKSGKTVDVKPAGVEHPVYKYGLALKVYMGGER